MYQIVLYLYLCGVAIASLFSEKVRKMWRGEREAIRILKERVDPQAQYVWFHAASLGEFEQGRPLMERLRRDHPEYKILRGCRHRVLSATRHHPQCTPVPACRAARHGLLHQV